MKTALYLTLAVLIAPGCMVAYVYFVRPALEGVPALKKFYTEADTFWAKVWALCGKSVTILWSYILAMIGAVVQLIDPVAAALGDPDLKGQVTNMLQANPKVLGYFAIFVSVVTILARLRSIGKT